VSGALNVWSAGTVGVFIVGGIALPISHKLNSSISIKSVKELIEIGAANSNYTSITSLTLILLRLI